MECKQVCKSSRLLKWPTALDRNAAIDGSFCLESPFLSVVSSEESVRSVLPLASFLHAPAPGLKLYEGRHGVCTPLENRVRAVCAERSNRVLTPEFSASLECTHRSSVPVLVFERIG